ncbi:hypothetical protein BO82DRAFT_410486 [Aspergillus uvarum CBS 121591]|uniref:Uncharacterized protein n=1 Tax=Aspergillus uvarum CBS 121591 TaxID=1448315 RepID=A0A319D5Z4_9EURO|nr:hypothetical protein BO82DRAFT_410486 [Aspergillus uvarum CBS 121591]PYH75442.1 hypothetical protein BO82DRAFT_410486 [Aspergillus uvarum CBS 121591]
MEEIVFSQVERQLAAEQQLKYQGTARVELSQISIDSLGDQEIDQKNVERLSQIFLKNGCRRLRIRNHVTAIIPKHCLDRACRAASVTSDQLKSSRQNPPLLAFPNLRLQCIHGKHRLKAAAETLPPSDRWWTVDLYLDDISLELRNALADEYGDEKHPSDGEIYRKYRYYQRENNALSQERWLLRLSENKASRIKQLNSTKNSHLCAALNKLLAIPGLWNGLSLGSMNSVMALKCDEEIIHYLTHIKSFWAALVDHDSDKMSRIDTHTVETLQLYAPRASDVDQKIVEGRILSGEVFSNFSRSERAAILENLQMNEDCEGVIPSLTTFFHDINYLKLCADGVERLVELNGKYPTVRSALINSFQPQSTGDEYLIQTSENNFRRQSGPKEERLMFGYRQLWMYAMRHYPNMPREIRCDQKSRTAQAKGRAKADDHVIFNMAVLARKLGFRSPQIMAILKESPDLKIALDALLRARKSTNYTYGDENLRTLSKQIVRCFARAVPIETPPALSRTGQAIALRERCGAPPADIQPLECSGIFLDQLHSPVVKQRILSSMEVRRSVYYAFFGKPPHVIRYFVTARQCRVQVKNETRDSRRGTVDGLNNNISSSKGC